MHSLFHASQTSAASSVSPPSVHTSTDVVAGATVPARRRFFDGQHADSWGHTQLRDVRRKEVQRILAAPQGIASRAHPSPKATLSRFVAVWASSFVADALLDVGGISRDFLLHMGPRKAPNAPTPLPVQTSRFWRPRAAAAPSSAPPVAPAWPQRVDDACGRLFVLPLEASQALGSASLTGATWALTTPVALGTFVVALCCTHVALRQQTDDQIAHRLEQLQTVLGLEQRFGHMLGTDAWLAQAQMQAPLEPPFGEPTRRNWGSDEAMAVA